MWQWGVLWRAHGHFHVLLSSLDITKLGKTITCPIPKAFEIQSAVQGLG